MSIEKFGTNFEEKVIQSMLADHAFAEQLLDVVEPELFDLASCKELSRVLKEYYLADLFASARSTASMTI